jgi:hypothetical protein
VPPKGAPNVLLIMTDDVGYSAPSTFGGVIPTPAMDRIAAAGLPFTDFHSDALCSPTRAALITGRNHHSVGNGVVGEISTGYRLRLNRFLGLLLDDPTEFRIRRWKLFSIDCDGGFGRSRDTRDLLSRRSRRKSCPEEKAQCQQTRNFDRAAHLVVDRLQAPPYLVVIFIGGMIEKSRNKDGEQEVNRQPRPSFHAGDAADG